MWSPSTVPLLFSALFFGLAFSLGGGAASSVGQSCHWSTDLDRSVACPVLVSPQARSGVVDQTVLFPGGVFIEVPTLETEFFVDPAQKRFKFDLETSFRLPLRKEAGADSWISAVQPTTFSASLTTYPLTTLRLPDTSS